MILSTLDQNVKRPNVHAYAGSGLDIERLVPVFGGLEIQKLFMPFHKSQSQTKRSRASQGAANCLQRLGMRPLSAHSTSTGPHKKTCSQISTFSWQFSGCGSFAHHFARSHIVRHTALVICTAGKRPSTNHMVEWCRPIAKNAYRHKRRVDLKDHEPRDQACFTLRPFYLLRDPPGPSHSLYRV